jgi:hypothetical protein
LYPVVPVAGELGLVAVVHVAKLRYPEIVGVVMVTPEAITPPVTCVNAIIYPYAVYVPEDVNV